MKALLLAAGLGTRLRPITNTLPKCLVPIHGRPLLEYWLDLLLGNEISDVLINTHYFPEQVRAFCEQSKWCKQIHLVHEVDLLGTGGTVLINRDFFGRSPILVAHADNLSRFSVKEFLSAHQQRTAGTTMTMMTFKTDSPESCGIVMLDKRGVVTQFHEKSAAPPGNTANAAVYIFEPEVIDFMAALNKPLIDLSTEVIPHFVNQISTFLNVNYHRDIGTPLSLALAHAEFSIPPKITVDSKRF